MGIKEEIKDCTEKITSINKYVYYMTKLGIIEKKIERYLKKESYGFKNIQFNSQDLRSLVIKLEKIHKAMNKSISFVEMEKKYAKRNYIDRETMKEDGKMIGKRIAHTIILQEQIAKFNHHATVCFFIEMQYDKEKQEDDKILAQSIKEALDEIYNS